METITITGVVLRFGFALLLVLVTFNPTGYSYAHWFGHYFPHLTPYIVLAGLVLIAGWIVFLRATMRSLGTGGVLLVMLVAGALVWLFVYWGWISITSGSAFAWIALVITALVLSIGMSWSHIRRRMSGQADVDEIDSR